LFVAEYYNKVMDTLVNLEKKEKKTIIEAGKEIAKAIEDDKLIHVFGCGHSHMLAEELFYRAGGLITINPIFDTSVMLHEGAIRSSQIEKKSGYARFVIDRYEISNGDIFLIASNSGINPYPIEMAQAAKERGAYVIGIVSESYRNAKSRHPENIHLSDVCDMWIDNYVEYGDASVEISNDGQKAGPISSISVFFIANSIMLSACDYLKERGANIPVLVSGNIEGGYSLNKDLLDKYKYRIKHL
jgi:uncharacterized phosphosugar-binding protein